MNNRIIVVLLLVLLACGRKSSETISADSSVLTDTTKLIQTDSLSLGQKNYEKSMIHRVSDNDSLLLDIPDLKRLVNSFTSKPKIKEKEYGAGDYFGKYRIYANKQDTLIIGKGDGGDYGFGNSIYLKRNDSIILFRSYEFHSLASDTGQYEVITEQLITFTNGTMNFKKREMRTQDWSQLKFTTNFTSVTEDAAERYKSLTDELSRLYKRELIE